MNGKTRPLFPTYHQSRISQRRRRVEEDGARQKHKKECRLIDFRMRQGETWLIPKLNQRIQPCPVIAYSADSLVSVHLFHPLATSTSCGLASHGLSSTMADENQPDRRVSGGAMYDAARDSWDDHHVQQPPPHPPQQTQHPLVKDHLNEISPSVRCAVLSVIHSPVMKYSQLLRELPQNTMQPKLPSRSKGSVV